VPPAWYVVSVHACECVDLYVHFHVSVYTCKKDVAHETYVYIYKCVHIHICICIKQICIREHIYTYIYTKYIYECTHKYICTHILWGGCEYSIYRNIHSEKKVQYVFCKRAVCISKRALIISQKNCTLTWLLRSAVFFFFVTALWLDCLSQPSFTRQGSAKLITGRGDVRRAFTPDQPLSQINADGSRIHD